MLLFLARRVVQGLAVILVTGTVVFFSIYVIGDPADLLISQNATQIEIAETRKYLGLDRPLYEQYLSFVANVLTGDLGKSFVYGRPALAVILDRFPATIELAFAAFILAIVIGIPLGLFCGLRPKHPVARFLMAGSVLGISLPSFWIGILLMVIFAVELGLLPTTGRGESRPFLGISWSFLTVDGLRHLALPAINLALWQISLVLRLTRSGTIEVLRQDYIRFARAKGLTPARILRAHVLKNVLAPVVTMLGLSLGSTIAFAIVTETVFAWPGVGKLLIDSIHSLDRPVVVSYLMFTVAMFVVLNTLVDIIYAAIDPRVRLHSRSA